MSEDIVERQARLLNEKADEITRLRAELGAAHAEVVHRQDELGNLLHAVEAERDSLRAALAERSARVAMLEGALRPFAEAAKRFKPYPSKANEAPVKASFTLGQLRAAERAVLAGAPGPEPRSPANQLLNGWEIPAAIETLKNRIDIRLNDCLCEMKPDYDDSIVGFNEAWDIVRKVFADALGKPAPATESE